MFKKKNVESNVKIKKPIYKRKWFIALAVLFLIGAVGNLAGGNEENEETSEPTENVEVQEVVEETTEELFESLSTEEKGIKIVEEVVGLETNMDEERMVSTSLSENSLALTMVANENLTVSMMQRSMVMNAKDIFEEIYTRMIEAGEIEEAVIVWQIEFTDTYGNAELKNAMILTLTKETGEKINWDNISTDNIESLTKDWQHPALNE